MNTYIKYLEKFEKSWQKKGLTITVTGLSGSGKSTIAEAIAKDFKLKLFSAGDIQRKFARQKGISIYEASLTRPKRVDYEMDKSLLKLAIKGGCVLVGRLSAWVAGNWAECKIFIDCQRKIRARRVAQRDNLTFKEALIKINQRDEADQKRYQELYGLNIKERKVFDLIIKNNREGIEKIKKEVIKKIKKFLKKKI